LPFKRILKVCLKGSPHLNSGESHDNTIDETPSNGHQARNRDLVRFMLMHRTAYDGDAFTDQSFSHQKCLNQLKANSPTQTLQGLLNTGLEGFFMGVSGC
jgi:hypothetical protein